MYAVVVSGGRQYRVSEGDEITVDRLAAQVGSSIELQQVLMIGGEGTDIRVGMPSVAGAVVKADVVAHVQGDKRESFRYTRTRRTRVRRGSRPAQTTLTITTISA